MCLRWLWAIVKESNVESMRLYLESNFVRLTRDLREKRDTRLTRDGHATLTQEGEPRLTRDARRETRKGDARFTRYDKRDTRRDVYARRSALSEMSVPIKSLIDGAQLSPVLAKNSISTYAVASMLIWSLAFRTI